METEQNPAYGFCRKKESTVRPPGRMVWSIHGEPEACTSQEQCARLKYFSDIFNKIEQRRADAKGACPTKAESGSSDTSFSYSRPCTVIPSATSSNDFIINSNNDDRVYLEILNEEDMYDQVQDEEEKENPYEQIDRSQMKHLSNSTNQGEIIEMRITCL